VWAEGSTQATLVQSSLAYLLYKYHEATLADDIVEHIKPHVREILCGLLASEAATLFSYSRAIKAAMLALKAVRFIAVIAESSFSISSRLFFLDENLKPTSILE
jgi:hypothetical protein